MNLLLVETTAPEYRIPPGHPRWNHLREVLQVATGGKLFLGVANGPRVLATVTTEGDVYCLTPDWETAVDPDTPVTAAALDDLEKPGGRIKPGSGTTVLVGLPRPQTARRVLFEAACQGVRHLVFFGAERGETSYAQSKLWTTGEWRRHLVEGAEQAFHTQLPEVIIHPNLVSAVSALSSITADQSAALPDITDRAELPPPTRLALDVYEAAGSLGSWAFARHRADPLRGAVLAIGAERGWSPTERQVLREAHFQLCHLGVRVLRVETALTASVTLLRAAQGLC